jgi:hypothetical protein
VRTLKNGILARFFIFMKIARLHMVETYGKAMLESVAVSLQIVES